MADARSHRAVRERAAALRVAGTTSATRPRRPRSRSGSSASSNARWRARSIPPPPSITSSSHRVHVHGRSRPRSRSAAERVGARSRRHRPPTTATAANPPRAKQEAVVASMTMLAAIRETLLDEMARDERVVLLGEDVGKNGGVFRATDGALERFGDRSACSTCRSRSRPSSAPSVGLSIARARAGRRDPVRRLHHAGVPPARRAARPLPVPQPGPLPVPGHRAHRVRRRRPHARSTTATRWRRRTRTRPG